MEFVYYFPSQFEMIKSDRDSQIYSHNTAKFWYPLEKLANP